MHKASESVELNTLNKLVETIQDVKNGLDPDVVSRWYEILEAEAKVLCPNDELSSTISVIQNPDLPMKFEFKSSKRAIPYVIEAIENNLNSMPFATRLYFQKFEEIIEAELSAYLRNLQA
jgi:isocitrate dehydrogenase kinase/phosphatase